ARRDGALEQPLSVDSFDGAKEVDAKRGLTEVCDLSLVEGANGVHHVARRAEGHEGVRSAGEVVAVAGEHEVDVLRRAGAGMEGDRVPTDEDSLNALASERLQEISEVGREIHRHP